MIKVYDIETAYYKINSKLSTRILRLCVSFEISELRMAFLCKKALLETARNMLKTP